MMGYIRPHLCCSLINNNELFCDFFLCVVQNELHLQDLPVYALDRFVGGKVENPGNVVGLIKAVRLTGFPP